MSNSLSIGDLAEAAKEVGRPQKEEDAYGAMNSGNHSQTKIPRNVNQKNLTRFF
jgi:hypothetical protein